MESHRRFSRQLSQASFTTATSLTNCSRISESVLPDNLLTGYVQFNKTDKSQTNIKPYIAIETNSAVRPLALYLRNGWSLGPPEIVIDLISNKDYAQIWPEENYLSDLHLGVIKTISNTDIWIVTEGLRYWITETVGAAVSEHLRSFRHLSNRNVPFSEYKSDVVLLGLVEKDLGSYGDMLYKNARFTTEGLNNPVSDPEEYASDSLEPNHSQFILVKNAYESSHASNSSVNYGTKYKPRILKALNIYKQMIETFTQDKLEMKREIHIPYVGLLIQGGPREIDKTLWLVKHQIPVIVIRGKKNCFASALIADAYSEGSKLLDPLYMETVVKPKILEKVAMAFSDKFDNDLDRIICRDRILECAKTDIVAKSNCLTIIDQSNKDHDLKDLRKFILNTLIKSQSHLELDRYLSLALKWDCPKIVSKLFLKHFAYFDVNTRDEVFYEALIKSNREAFVDMFLNFGFSLSEFMKKKREDIMFGVLFCNQYFLEMILNPIMGHKTEFVLETFLYHKTSTLNTILLQISGLRNIINITDMKIDTKVQTSADKAIAESEALKELLLWSILTNNPDLTKVLWRHTHEPIHTALVISTMFFRLSKFYISDLDTKHRLYKTSVEFSSVALGVLNKIYNDSALFAFRTLSTPSVNFNNFTAIELAFIGHNKFFIAHPCCQAGVKESWEGSIKIKNMRLNLLSDFKVPEFIKILSCLFLVFPIYFWINFDKAYKLSRTISSEHYDGSESPSYGDKKRQEKEEDISMITKIIYLWNAPVSKFWLYVFCYFIYMVLISIWILLPPCSQTNITITLIIWNIVVVIEQLQMLFVWKNKFPTISLFSRIWDICINLYVLFLLGVSFIQTSNNHLQLINHIDVKIAVAFGIIWYFYKFLNFLLPVSTSLGPMMVNMKKMITSDFIKWLLLWSMCFISGGLAIFITRYPLQIPDFYFIRQAILTGLWSIFKIPKVKRSSTVECQGMNEGLTDTCNLEKFDNISLSNLQYCPYQSSWSKMFTVQLRFITYLVFYSLWFGIYGLTLARTEARSIEIWKYQFYQNVCYFQSRPIFPAPLSIISYTFRVLKFVVYWLFRGKLCCDKLLGLRARGPKRQKQLQVPYNQMKSYTMAVDRKDEDYQASMRTTLSIFEEKNEEQTKNLNRLRDRIIIAERNQIQTNLVLETLITKLENLIHKKIDQPQKRLQDIHKEARKSPYPGTDLERFPVFEKDVLWENKYDTYDPIFYSQPIDSFSEELRPFIDRDDLHKRYSIFNQKTVDVQQIPNYNQVNEYTYLGQSVSINRRTNILPLGYKEFTYDLDFMNLPINPMGRTGVRGRGALCHYGPNHLIQAVISRWRASAPVQAESMWTFTKNTSQSEDKDNTHALEVLVIFDYDNGVASLPGVAINIEKSYGAMCKYFKTEVLYEENEERFKDFDEEDMVQYFSQFASTDEKIKQPIFYVSHGFSATPIYRGYVDSALNTDNAWQETEVWNFHYKYKNNFEARLKVNQNAKWVTAYADLPMSSAELAAVQGVYTIHTEDKVHRSSK